MLKRLGNFKTSGSIGIGFDHRHDFGFGTKFTFEEIQIVNQGFQIDFQYGIV